MYVNILIYMYKVRAVHCMYIYIYIYIYLPSGIFEVAMEHDPFTWMISRSYKW